MNTHSKKWNIVVPDPMVHLDNDALDQQYFFALPSSLDPNDIVQLIQPDTISYDLADPVMSLPIRYSPMAFYFRLSIIFPYTAGPPTSTAPMRPSPTIA